MSLWYEALGEALMSADNPTQKTQELIRFLSMPVPREWWEQCLQDKTRIKDFAPVLNELCSKNGLLKKWGSGMLIALAFANLDDITRFRYSLKEYDRYAKKILKANPEVQKLGEKIDSYLHVNPMKRQRFTIEERRWYGVRFIGDEYFDLRGYQYSPIRVDGIRPLKTGKGIFELNFYHANYPSGVNDNLYRLKTLERGETYILAKSTEHTPAKILHIQSITWEWINDHFPEFFRHSIEQNISIEELLEFNCC